jgi:hypothetical protein
MAPKEMLVDVALLEREYHLDSLVNDAQQIVENAL